MTDRTRRTQPASPREEQETIVCDLCGCSDYDVVFPERKMRPLSESDFTVLGEQGEHPQIVRCSECGLVYANPRDTGKQLAGKYQSLPIEGYLLEESSRRLTCRRDAELVRQYVPSGRVLDIGCSAGLFLDSLEGDYDRCGVELGRESAAIAQKLIGPDRIHNGLLETAGFEPGSFDCVTLWDVIEHLPSPKKALHQAADLLKDGGVLVLMTPDIGSPFARMLGTRWPHLIRSHIFYFTRRTLGRMLRECGFEPLRWSTYSRRFTLRYLLERIGLLTPRAKDSPAAGGIGAWTVPVNFFDACLVVARKRS